MLSEEVKPHCRNTDATAPLLERLVDLLELSRSFLVNHTTSLSKSTDLPKSTNSHRDLLWKQTHTHQTSFSFLSVRFIVLWGGTMAISALAHWLSSPSTIKCTFKKVSNLSPYHKRRTCGREEQLLKGEEFKQYLLKGNSYFKADLEKAWQAISSGKGKNFAYRNTLTLIEERLL